MLSLPFFVLSLPFPDRKEAMFTALIDNKCDRLVFSLFWFYWSYIETGCSNTALLNTVVLANFITSASSDKHHTERKMHDNKSWLFVILGFSPTLLFLNGKSISSLSPFAFILHLQTYDEMMSQARGLLRKITEANPKLWLFFHEEGYGKKCTVWLQVCDYCISLYIHLYYSIWY